jgi:hypothetical protein
MKLNIKITESYVTYVVRDNYIIDTDDYPELKNLNQEEAIQYVKENAETIVMKDNKWEQSLLDVAKEMDIIRDKILDDNYELHVVLNQDNK